MKQYFSLIKNVPLFYGISEDEYPGLLDCLNATISHYPRDSMIFFASNAVPGVGIVCEGQVQVIREDIFGNRTILAKLSEGDLFGETFACARIDTLPVSVMASSDSTVLIINYRKIITAGSCSCGHHNKLIENMLSILAEKNLMLNQKNEVLSARTTREKLISFFSAQAVRAQSNSFEIPFSRQELADYLSVDRSAMSTELGRMRNEGILNFHKSCFNLLISRE